MHNRKSLLFYLSTWLTIGCTLPIPGFMQDKQGEVTYPNSEKSDYGSFDFTASLLIDRATVGADVPCGLALRFDLASYMTQRIIVGEDLGGQYYPPDFLGSAIAQGDNVTVRLDFSLLAETSKPVRFTAFGFADRNGDGVYTPGTDLEAPNSASFWYYEGQIYEQRNQLAMVFSPTFSVIRSPYAIGSVLVKDKFSFGG